MLKVMTIVISGLSLVMSASALYLVWYRLNRQPEPRVIKGELVIDHSRPQAGDTRVRTPDGLVSFIDSQGVLRTERGRYDPLAGQVVRGESNDSPGGDVIAFHRRAGKQ